MSIASSFLNDQDPENELKSFSHLLAGAMSPPGPSMEKAPTEESKPPTAADSNVGSNSPARSFAERLAARGAAAIKSDAGATVAPGTGTGTGTADRPPPPSNGSRFNNLPPPSSLPNPRTGAGATGASQGYLTIPAGLSPTTLFDASPVMLSNAQACVRNPPLLLHRPHRSHRSQWEPMTGIVFCGKWPIVRCGVCVGCRQSCLPQPGRSLSRPTTMGCAVWRMVPRTMAARRGAKGSCSSRWASRRLLTTDYHLWRIWYVGRPSLVAWLPVE
jgi:hypothetical protein